MTLQLETPTPRTELSDRAVSYLRTFVPAWWGALVTLALAWISPHLPDTVSTALADLLGSEAALALITAAAIALWYWAWRRLEAHLPDWLVRIVLGSARTPGYALAEVSYVDDDGTDVAVITDLTDRDRIVLAQLHDFLDLTDPSREALDKVLARSTSTL
ncbi:hypothetical protein [Actinotalea sp. JY-7876]|uniref:hypothetical protein n=1 Tax=Actinotalea sp. JY-7876 TaxID=2758442 RepID=UPI0015F610A1|nr:hypothetical protein [Actinotalea sp. JY-7876]